MSNDAAGVESESVRLRMLFKEPIRSKAGSSGWCWNASLIYSVHRVGGPCVRRENEIWL